MIAGRHSEDYYPITWIGRRCSSLAIIVALSLHELVTMHSPVVRSTSADNPRQPSMALTIGATSVVTNFMPASIASGLPWNVVERANTAHSLQSRGSAQTGTAGSSLATPSAHDTLGVTDE